MAHVLIVEDDPDQRELRQMVVESDGHTVVAADSAQAAVSCCGVTPAPDCVVMDLRLPGKEDGLRLIGQLKAALPQLPIIVLTGAAKPELDLKPAGAAVAAVLRKPVRSEKLLSAIARLTACIVFLCCLVAEAQVIPFRTPASGESVADLTLDAPGCSWDTAGKEAAVVRARVDSGVPFHIFVYGGSRAVAYPVFLGPLTPGDHTLSLERDAMHSAPECEYRLIKHEVRHYAAGDPMFQVLAHAPVLFARANTVGKFTDIPLLLYCTRDRDSLEYTFIFSNEDEGTSTRDLMARWGRVTDIEYVYRVWLDAQGNATRTQIQTRGHRDASYTGPQFGRHPMLMVVTDNNMVAPEGPGPVRYQLAPIPADLSRHSREQVMDDHPLTYAIAAMELRREDKLRPFGVVMGEKISDPRNYLVVEAQVTHEKSVIQPIVRLKGSERSFTGSAGVATNHIERNGWFRSAVELPPGTDPANIVEIGFQCSAALKEKAGACTLQAVGNVFLLNQDYVPGSSLFARSGPWRIPSGEILWLPLASQ